MISALGAVFIALAGGVVALRPHWLPWVLAAAVPFTATAGVTIAGQSLVMYPLVAVVLIAITLHRGGLKGALDADLRIKPAAALLLVLAVWSALVTAIGPVFFEGLAVLDPKQGIDGGIANPALLQFRLSNIAQGGYLLIGVATVFVLGTLPKVSPHLPAMAFGTGTVVSSIRYALPENLQTKLFDTSNNVAYTAGEFNGVERLRGIFSEPSTFGAFSAAGAVFFLAASTRFSGGMKVLYLILGIWSFVNAVYSFSGGALVTGLVVFGFLGARGLVNVLRGNAVVSQVGLLVLLLVPVAAVLFGERVIGFVSLMLSDKASSTSYENRSAADEFSYAILSKTYGVGVGLGSNRPSSFVASLVSTTGILGVLLFSAVLLIVIAKALAVVEFQPAALALVTIVVSKAVSGPDISDPPLWFLLGLCAYAAWNERHDRSSASVYYDDPVLKCVPGAREFDCRQTLRGHH